MIKKNAGFTLLEVLVALTVVAVALSTLIKATGDIASNTHYMREKAMAHWVAMNRLAELQIEPKWLETGTDKDEMEVGGTEWTWFQKVEDTPDEYIRRLEIRVAPAEDKLNSENDPALATLTAYIINPEIISTTPFVINNGNLMQTFPSRNNNNTREPPPPPPTPDEPREE